MDGWMEGWRGGQEGRNEEREGAAPLKLNILHNDVPISGRECPLALGMMDRMELIKQETGALSHGAEQWRQTGKLQRLGHRH